METNKQKEQRRRCHVGSILFDGVAKTDTFCFVLGAAAAACCCCLLFAGGVVYDVVWSVA